MFQCIAATTVDEYRKYIEKDPALKRRFQPVDVSEPSVEEAIEILKGLSKKYEAHHHVQYSDNALIAAARLSSQYIRLFYSNYDTQICSMTIFLINQFYFLYFSVNTTFLTKL